MDTRAVQGGPYGEISITLPKGWNYEAYPMDSDELISGMYGIQFHPEALTLVRDVREGGAGVHFFLTEDSNRDEK